MLVSTRVATRESTVVVIEVVSSPTAFFAGGPFALVLPEFFCLKFVDSLHSCVKERQPLFGG
jgi:hypothetical protein